jgi:hypothetical protein
MGTFHQNKHELHGITVVVDTRGDDVLIGRCDDMDHEKIILLDVDVHTDGEDGKTKQEYIARAVKFGTWKKHDQVVVALADVESVKPLGQYA